MGGCQKVPLNFGLPRCKKERKKMLRFDMTKYHILSVYHIKNIINNEKILKFWGEIFKLVTPLWTTIYPVVLIEIRKYIGDFEREK